MVTALRTLQFGQEERQDMFPILKAPTQCCLFQEAFLVPPLLLCAWGVSGEQLLSHYYLWICKPLSCLSSSPLSLKTQSLIST